jgi:hypothetical protein
VFQTEALSGSDMLLILALTSTLFWVEEGKKWYHRKHGGRSLLLHPTDGLLKQRDGRTEDDEDEHLL